MKFTGGVLLGLLLVLLLSSCGGITEGIEADLRANSTVGEPASSIVPPLTRNQYGRNTCQTFGATAALEAAYKRQFGIDIDISEEFINYSGKTFFLRYDLYGGALPAEQGETQLAAWGGGGGTGWLYNLSNGYAAPADDTMRYRSGGYSLAPYCGSGCAYGSDEYKDFSQLQRNLGDFNLNQANLPMSALTAGEYYSVRSFETIDARDPAVFEDVLDQGYEIVWDFWVRGYRSSDPSDPIWRPRIFTDELTITRSDDGDTDALPKTPVFDILEVKQGDTVFEKDTDWQKEGDAVKWISDNRPEEGSDYTVKWQHEAQGGSHVMLIVGYNPLFRYFIVKNSWDTSRTADEDGDGSGDGWTYISYNYVRRYGIEASYITEVNPPRPWPELPFVGRWNLSFDGHHGVLDIYHIPGISQHHLDDAYARDPGRYPGANVTDRRIGTFYADDGAAFRVNGSMDENHITFYIDMNDPDMPIDQLSGRRFEYYRFREDVDSMAGFHYDENGSRWGGYALRCPPSSWPACGADWLQSEFDSARPFTPESWIGKWDLVYDGHQAELIITERDDTLLDGTPGYAGMAAELKQGGASHDVVVRVDLSSPAEALIPIISAGSSGGTRAAVLAEVKHLSWESGVAAGSFTSGVTDFGVYMVRSSSLLIAEIISPVERLLQRPRNHLFDVKVIHDPVNECCTYEWTSSQDGFLSDQQSFTKWGADFTPGVHTIQVMVRDDAGNQASDEIEVEFPENQAPDVEITFPLDGASFTQSQTITLRGTSVDRDHPPSLSLDDSEVFWYLDGSSSSFATGHVASLSGLSIGSHSISFFGSDGYASDTDSITISVIEDPVDLPPTATINSPTQGQVFWADTYDDGNDAWYINVSLQGQGTDPEDGTLSGGSLKWRSSSGGPAQVIGSGNGITVPLYGNCGGTAYTITLTATDSGGNKHTDQITIVVNLLC